MKMGSISVDVPPPAAGRNGLLSYRIPAPCRGESLRSPMA